MPRITHKKNTKFQDLFEQMVVEGSEVFFGKILELCRVMIIWLTWYMLVLHAIAMQIASEKIFAGIRNCL